METVSLRDRSTYSVAIGAIIWKPALLSYLIVLITFSWYMRFCNILVILMFNNDQRNIVYVIESAAYGVLFTSCLCQKPERARYERVRAFDTNNE
jgi:hypothetical protein